MAFPTLGIKFSEFKPTLYNPTQYSTVTYDPKVLPQSLEKQYNWNQRGNQAAIALQDSFDKIRSGLNPAEYSWWDEVANKSLDRVYNSLDAGNAESSIAFAQAEARKMFRDTDLKNKIDYNTSREKELAKIQSRSDVNDDVKRAAKLLNTYNYNGNPEYKLTFDPVSSIGMEQIAGLVANLTPDRSSSYSNQTSNAVMMDKNGNITTDITKAVGKIGTTGGGIGSTIHWKSADELRGMFYNVITNNSKINSALKQQYDVAKVLYDEANRLVNDISLTEAEREKAREDLQKYGMELTDKDGFIPSYDGWLKRKAVPMIEAMAYRNVDTRDTRHSSYDDDLFERNKAANAAKKPKIEEDDNTPTGVVKTDPKDINSSASAAFETITSGITLDASSDALLIGG